MDYGDYTALRNMTSSKELNFTDQKITIEADAGRLYYEGILDEATLPWNFEIKYWLDGVALSAEELAGKQGHLQIDIEMCIRDRQALLHATVAMYWLCME